MYCKPHFGPEETTEVIIKMQENQRNKVAQQRRQLEAQINENKEDRQTRQEKDKSADRRRLEVQMKS